MRYSALEIRLSGRLVNWGQFYNDPIGCDQMGGTWSRAPFVAAIPPITTKRAAHNPSVENSKCDQTGVWKIVVDTRPVAPDKCDQTGGRLDHMIDETTCLLRRVAL
jgi:hypothetical protein